MPCPECNARMRPAGGRCWTCPQCGSSTCRNKRVRYVAVEMAALGCTRAQVDAHLRGFLGAADPGELLDQIYGHGSDGATQAPWAIRGPE